MASINVRAGRLMTAGLPAILTSHLLFRADQEIFGLPSDFLAGFMLVAAVALFLAGLALTVRSHHGGQQ